MDLGESTPKRPMSLGPIGCSRCEGKLILEAWLARFGNEPAQSVYRCEVCGQLDWIEEHAGT
jgi:hypothetical protein